MPDSTPPTLRTLADFESYMQPDGWGRGWVLVDRRADMLKYEKTTPAANGSCLLAGILLLIGLIPGILYLAFARHSASMSRLTVTVQPDGSLMPSGDSEAIRKFDKFLDPQSSRSVSRWQVWAIAALGALALLGFLAWMGQSR